MRCRWSTRRGLVRDDAHSSPALDLALRKDGIWWMRFVQCNPSLAAGDDAGVHVATEQSEHGIPCILVIFDAHACLHRLVRQLMEHPAELELNPQLSGLHGVEIKL